MWPKTRRRRREHRHTVNFKTNIFLSSILLQLKRFLVLHSTRFPFFWTDLTWMCSVSSFTSWCIPLVPDVILTSSLSHFFLHISNFPLALFFLFSVMFSNCVTPKHMWTLVFTKEHDLYMLLEHQTKEFMLNSEVFDYGISVLTLDIQWHCYMAWAVCIALPSFAWISSQI